MAGSQRTLLADADVLIDYSKSDLSILGLVAKHTGPLYVLRNVLKTVDDLSVTQCKKLGISIVEAQTTLLLEAGRRSGALSFKDWLCFLLSEQNGWTCVTNDRALIRECKQCKIRYRRGLRLMIDLVKTGHLRKARARKVASDIHKANPHHINERVLARFEQALGKT